MADKGDGTVETADRLAEAIFDLYELQRQSAVPLTWVHVVVRALIRRVLQEHMSEHE